MRRCRATPRKHLETQAGPAEGQASLLLQPRWSERPSPQGDGACGSLGWRPAPLGQKQPCWVPRAPTEHQAAGAENSFRWNPNIPQLEKRQTQLPWLPLAGAPPWAY